MTDNHRSRTAERRRDAMRRRLIESAMPVFAEKGVDAVVIDDVILAAGVSRGTFYKYFPSTRDLMVAISEELGNELMSLVESVVAPIPDPAHRVALGLRLFIDTAQAFPLFAGFARVTGLEAAGPTSLIYDYLPPHLEEGREQGQFMDIPLAVSLDSIAGAVLLSVLRQSVSAPDTQQVEQVVSFILRGLGMTPDEADRIAAMPPLPLILPQDSLLVRAHRRMEMVAARG
ncbi:MAG: TetR/AcrR family transcriptional regulator [Paracoccus sp. (in: a-proteobacteria)]|uniref:TetR/AcrR family transcriptional regulator n=1 Tax=Paracoccus sp. TaxID=267 RepID=UPI0026E0DED8|nr:TetR/AcrR family transcriptional regulator [Paracoccus sp. (in: a-proteobacteria)]MDO5633069.1 TetR/AcrR family transcriptional regulator [Paracoccus sp. (in: a-proteobacteria)]